MSSPDAKGIRHISEVSTGPEVGNLTIAQLAYLNQHPDHPMNAPVWHDCHGRPSKTENGERIPCPTKERFQCMAYFSEMTVCDGCRSSYEKDMKLDQAKKYWESICPEDYRDTDKKHAGFPAGIYATLKDWNGTESLFLYGPSGSGKTRVGILLLKRRLLQGAHVGCLWPEEMKDAAKSHDRLAKLKYFTRYDVLLMDDSLLTGAQDEKIADFLKDCVELAIRQKRTVIFTSQIGGDDYLAQGDKFDNMTKTDSERIKALLRRIRERCRVVPFATATPTSDSQDQTF